MSRTFLQIGVVLANKQLGDFGGIGVKGIILAHCLQCWTDIKPTFGQCLVFPTYQIGAYFFLLLHFTTYITLLYCSIHT